jgi:hypothetical protein
MQFYQDKGAYPSSIEDFVWTSWLSVKDYLMVLRGDPLWLVEINWCKFGYHYEVWLDNQSYRLSTCLEDEENIKKSASNSYDWWIDNNKFERWINLKWKFDTWFYIVNNNVITIEETDSNRIMNPDISLYTNFDMTDNASDTRNYKRKSDVSIIAWEITVKLAMWAKITDFVKIERTGTTTINWNEVIVSQWVVNFEKLGLNREDYLDPLTKKDYIIAFAETQVNWLTLAWLPNTFTEIFYEVGCMWEWKGIISAWKLGNLEHLIVFSD